MCLFDQEFIFQADKLLSSCEATLTLSLIYKREVVLVVVVVVVVVEQEQQEQVGRVDFITMVRLLLTQTKHWCLV